VRTRVALLLLGLAGVVALWAYTRTRSGAQAASDAVELVNVTVQRISDAVVPWLSRVPVTLKPVFNLASAAQRLPANLLEAVAYRESRFRADIISGATRSSAGAVGIMQIIPRWHPELGEAGALDPQRAIPYAAQYLRELYNEFGDWKIALAAYNWGPGNQRQDLKNRVAGDEWPTETRNYVAEISRNAGLA
jgi:soluble lytic murein transglycosylase-like protein